MEKTVAFNVSRKARKTRKTSSPCVVVVVAKRETNQRPLYSTRTEATFSG
jgi:hypothetical protein